MSHEPSFHDAIFDLCDINGKIKLSGTLYCSNEKTEIDLKAISKGSYHLFIIDEGEVYKELVTLN